MLSRKELKENAKQKLSGNWGEPIAVTAILGAITFGASFVFGLIVGILMIPLTVLMTGLIISGGEEGYLMSSIISAISEGVSNILSSGLSLLLVPLTIGFLTYFLAFAKNDGSKNISNVFEGYKKSFGKSILAAFLKGVYTFLWTLLFIVPGIIKTYAYSMTEYIIADDPSVSATEAIKRSQEMMDGHKWELFELEISFIGWGILALFTCGIGFLWLTPYMQTAITDFYLQLKEEYELKNQAY